VYFDLPRNCIIDAKGAKQFKIRITGHENWHVRVMLCVTAENHKLPLYILFPKDVIVREQKVAEWQRILWKIGDEKHLTKIPWRCT
jgi:hypothetical protein